MKTPLAPARPRRQLAGLALLFFAPLGLAFWFYYGEIGWRPGGRVNQGELIEPPQPLPPLALPLVTSPDGGATDPGFLTKKWTLLYWGAGDCPIECRRHLYDTRQVRTALNRDMSRVQRVFVAQDPCCDLAFLRSQHPDLIVVRAGEAARALGARLPAPNSDPAAANRIYLIDPLGNVMMWYAPDAKPKGMLQDLKRLLSLSQVG